MVHCWMSKTEYMEEKYGHLSDEWYEAFANDGICLLENGHKGEHIFTPEDKIMVTFEGENSEGEVGW